MHACKKKKFWDFFVTRRDLLFDKKLTRGKKNTRASAFGILEKKTQTRLAPHFFSLLLKVFFGVGALGVLFEGVCVVVVVVVVVVVTISITISITTTP